MIVGAIGGEQHEAIVSRRQILDLNFQAEGNDGTSLLNEIVHGDWTGVENFLVGVFFEDAIGGRDLGRIVVLQQRLIQFGIKNQIVSFAEAVRGRGSDLHALEDEGSAIFEESSVDVGGDLIDALEIGGEQNAANGELVAIKFINAERSFEFAEAVATGTEDDIEFVGARRRVELILVVVGQLGECFPLIFFELEVKSVVEASAHRTIWLISDSEHIDAGVVLPFVFVEHDGLAGNLHGEVDASDVWSRVKIWSLHGAVNGARLRASGLGLHLLFNGAAIERIRGVHVAITTAGANFHAALVEFDLNGMATALGGGLGNVTEEIEFVLISGDAIQTAEQIVGVIDGEAARALGEYLKNLLIGGGRRRNLRKNDARLGIGIVVVVGIRVVDRVGGGAATATSFSASARAGTCATRAGAATLTTASTTCAASASGSTCAPTGVTATAARAATSSATTRTLRIRKSGSDIGRGDELWLDRTGVRVGIGIGGAIRVHRVRVGRKN